MSNFQMHKNLFLKQIFIQFLDFLVIQFWSEEILFVYIVK